MKWSVYKEIICVLSNTAKSYFLKMQSAKKSVDNPVGIILGRVGIIKKATVSPLATLEL